MKKPIVNPPVFDPANRTLDFTSTPGFDVRRLMGVSHIRTGQLIYSPIRPALAPANLAGAVVTLSFNTNGMLPGDKLFIEYDDGINDLPPDAATAGRQDAQKLVLQDIRDSIRAQRVETIWTDDTGARFIRLDSAGTITWTDVAGNASAPPGAGARPDSDSSTVVSQSTYRAIAGGTGFAAQDYLNHIVVTDGDAGDLVSNFWLNVTAGTKIAAPSATSITPLAPLPDGASTAARQDTGNASLAAAVAGIGAPGDADPGFDTAPGSILALLRRGLGRWTTLLGRIPALGPAAAAGSIPVTLPADGQFAASVGLPADGAAASDAGAASLTALAKRALGNWTTLLARVPALVSGRVPVDGSGVTQPVSAAALPLPAGASTSALQATGNTALGAPADAAYAGAGSSSIVAALKGIYAALVTATPAGSAVIGRVGLDQTTPGTTNGVVVNASALPAGAAQDGTDPGSPAVANAGAGIRGWLATIAGLLKLGATTKAASGSVTIATDQGNLEPGGTAIAAAAMPAGGVGLTGWLSAIWAACVGATPAGANSIGTVGLNAGSNIIGRVSPAITLSPFSGTLAAGVGAQIGGGDATRQIVIISNTGANPMLWLVGGTPTGTFGHPLAPGATVVLDSKVPTAAVNAYSAAGTTYTISVGN